MSRRWWRRRWRNGTRRERRTEARMKGHVGEACPGCANFALVREWDVFEVRYLWGDDGVFVSSVSL